MERIDIIIPSYNAHKTINQTLASIAIQDYKDRIDVTIVNDSSNKDYKPFVDLYKGYLSIKEISTSKNLGPGGTRNLGLNNTKNKYIMFLDSDDTLYTNKSLNNIFKIIDEKKEFDLIVSSFYEDTGHSLIEKVNTKVWLHGKVYNRKFLKENNIMFPNTYGDEDNYFNESIILRNHKEIHIDDFTYIWKYNKNSITRKEENDYRFKALPNYLDSLSNALEGAINSKNGNKKEIAETSFQVLVFIYFSYLEFHDRKNINEVLIKLNKILEISKEYKIDKETKRGIYECQLNDYDKTYTNNPFITFKEFIKLVEEVNI